MGHQIIQRPNGLYTVWSSVVDDFILINATPQDIVSDSLDRERERITERVNAVVSRLENNEKPYAQFTMTFGEAVKVIKKRHGKSAESLRMLGVTSNG